MAKKAFYEGTRRAVAPEETWRRLQPLLSVFGISRVANITGLDRIGIPVFTAVRPNARSLSVYQGKGASPMAARVSAVMEAYETWCAEAVDQPLLFASFDEIRFARPVVDVSRLPVATVHPFDPGLPFLWIEGKELFSDGARWLPYEMVHANYAMPEPPHSGTFVASTNGLASGNTWEEALLHALCEVVERDAATLFKLGPDAWGDRLAVRLDSVDEPVCRELLGKVAAAGLDVAVFDITSDTAIPAFAALISDRTGAFGAPELGFGCHPAPEVALARALTEAAQARVTFISGAREDILDEDYAAEELNARQASAQGIINTLNPRRSFGETPSVETSTLEDDVEAVLRALDRVGINEVIAVDVSKPAFGLCVVRVVVPGLEAALEGPRSQYMPGQRAAAILTDEAA